MDMGGMKQDIKLIENLKARIEREVPFSLFWAIRKCYTLKYKFS